ncbi:MOSC domain-containing protein [Ottowia sp.]|uniref:MOSC domain-containing protein n=1 Tax=Ottowia sp. TaxID=1898956 RepID=UPI003A8C4990
MTPALSGQIRHVCVGAAQPLTIAGRTVLSGIAKRQVTGPVAVGALGLAGDEQVDLSVHGGLHKAVYAYPVEHMAFWQAERAARGLAPPGEVLPPGFVGENLGVTDLLEGHVWVGDMLHFPHCVLRVTGPREPCFKLAAVMGFAAAGKQMVRQARCGFYLAAEQPGTLAAGERFTLHPGPRALSIADAIHAKWAKHRHDED